MATRVAEREVKLARDFQAGETRRRIAVIIAYTILTAWAILSLAPLYLMGVLSLQKMGFTLTISDLNFFPYNPSWENYRNLFQIDAPWWIQRRPVGAWFKNSAIMAMIPTVSNLIFDSAAGYALAKLRFPGRRTIFWIIVMTMMLPYFVILVPLYRMMFEFNWLDTYWALVFPGLAGVSGIFLMKQNIQTLPTSLIDAARIDACGEFRIFWRIVLPLSKPILAVMGIFSFISGWNDFFWPYLVVRRQEMLTIQAGLSSLMGAGPTGMPPATNDMGIVMAASVLAAIPVIIVFFLFQRYIIQGVTVGAVKG